MPSPNSSLKKVASALAVTGALLTALPAMTWAQGLPGLTLFSGIERDNQLNFRLVNGRRNWWDTYLLRIPASKIRTKVTQFNINYPDYYNGQFDTNKVQVKVRNKSVPVQQVNWDRENRLLQITLQEPIEPGQAIELVLDNVRNPYFGGTYYFNARIMGPSDIPLPQYVGTWILDIAN